MKINEVSQSIGTTVTINNRGDLGMHSELRRYIRNKEKLVIEKLTKGGMVLLKDKDGNKLDVPPKNIDLA